MLRNTSQVTLARLGKSTTNVLPRHDGRTTALAARELALEMRRVVGVPKEPGAVLGLPSRLGWSLRFADLHHARALLIPTPTRSFEIVVGNHRDGLPRDDRMISFAACVAHEIGHAFFYSLDVVPMRRRPASASEEGFCDEFAIGLLSEAASSSALMNALRPRRIRSHV
jgi:hypothetical protein